MNLSIISIILSLIGEGLIAFIFFFVIPDKTFIPEVRILDFVVVSIVYWLWTYNALKPAVDLRGKAHKQVGGLGIRWAAVTWYSILALLLIAVNIVLFLLDEEPMGFKSQICLQAVFLFLFGAALLASERSMEKTVQVAESDERIKVGKSTVKSAISNLLIEVEDMQGIPENVKGRLREILAETRYLTPSSSPSAKEADELIEEDCRILHASIYDYDMNRDAIEKLIGKLERDMQRRRKTM